MIICNRLVRVQLSKAWDGWDCGLLSCKMIDNDIGIKAFHIVVWRLAVFVQLTTN